MDSPFLNRTKGVPQRDPPVIFLEMQIVSESSPVHLHDVLGLYPGRLRPNVWPP